MRGSERCIRRKFGGIDPLADEAPLNCDASTAAMAAAIDAAFRVRLSAMNEMTGVTPAGWSFPRSWSLRFHCAPSDLWLKPGRADLTDP